MLYDGLFDMAMIFSFILVGFVMGYGFGLFIDRFDKKHKDDEAEF